MMHPLLQANVVFRSVEVRTHEKIMHKYIAFISELFRKMTCAIFRVTEGGPFKKAQAIHLYAKQTFVLI